MMGRERTMTTMGEFDQRHRIDLPGGYWMEKADDNSWQIGREGMALGFQLRTNVPVGDGGSFDSEAAAFAAAMLVGNADQIKLIRYTMMRVDRIEAKAEAFLARMEIKYPEEFE